MCIRGPVVEISSFDASLNRANARQFTGWAISRCWRWSWRWSRWRCLRKGGGKLTSSRHFFSDREGIYDLLDGLELHGGHHFFFIGILCPNRRAIIPKSVDTLKDHILLSSRSKPRWIINTRTILIGEIVDRNFGEIISKRCFCTKVPRSAAPFSRNSVPNLVPTKGRHENPLEPKRVWRPHSTISLIFEFRAIQPMFTLYSLQNINFINCMLSICV